MPLFCRHNRFEASCPICSRDKPVARARAAAGPRPASGRTRRAPGMVTKKLARAAEDGYHSDLVPGIRATADAERLAIAVTIAVADLEQREPLADPLRDAAAAAFGDPDAVAGWTPPENASWTPERRFERWFDRLRLPGATRAQRFEFLVALGPDFNLEAGALFFDTKGSDAATLAAKRALNSGDTILLERRARTLADAAAVPIAALDRGLAVWDGTEVLDAPAAETIRSALRL